MEQEKPMISVIVPVYNVEAWIGRCLDSILAQTYENIEVILINDASSDESGRICDHYAARDGRITVLHFSENRGPSAARNEGIRKARGAFASFIDSDDYAEPCLLEKLYDNLLENGADVSACGADGIKLKGGPPGTFSRSEAVCCLAHGVPFNLVPWGKLYAMELVKKHPFDERYFYSEDLLFLYEILKSSNRVSYLPDRLYHYVNREGSQVHSGVSERKCTALLVHDKVCSDASVHFPEALSGFQQIALDTNTRMAMLAVETDMPPEELFGYLKRLCQNTRRHFSWKALMLCQEKKVVAASLLLYAGDTVFHGIADIYKQIKRWKGR
ncbi:MAG: glycosyltransferase [Ruminococcus sp.]|nr:glycosyltransferase [Ruminococcus sp.]